MSSDPTTTNAPTSEKQVPSRLGPWEISNIDFGIFICMTFCMTFIGSTIGFRSIDWLPSLASRSSGDLLGTVLGGYGLQLGAIGAFFAFSRLVKTKNRNNPVSIGQAIGYGLLALIGCYLVLVGFIPLWQLLLTKLGIPFEIQEPVMLVLHGGSPLEMALMYILIVVGAPLGEELFFRAGIFRFLNTRFGFAIATATSSILFGLVHNNVYSFGPLVVLGIAMCVIYQKTGSIISSISLHTAFNLISLIAILLTDRTDLV